MHIVNPPKICETVIHFVLLRLASKRSSMNPNFATSIPYLVILLCFIEISVLIKMVHVTILGKLTQRLHEQISPK